VTPEAIKGMTPEAIKEVGKARRPEDLPRLARWLVAAADPAARAQAAVCLGWQRSPGALDPLMDAARTDAASTVRASALRALGSLKAVEAEAVLDTALRDPDPDCRALALRLAGLLGTTRPEVARVVADPGAAEAVAYEACLAAGRLGVPGPSDDLWARYLSDGTEVRRAAAVAWCQLADASSAGRLPGLLADADADVRVAALGATERLRPPGAIERVAALLSDPHAAVRRVAEAVHGRMVAGQAPPSARSRRPSPR